MAWPLLAAMAVSAAASALKNKGKQSEVAAQNAEAKRLVDTKNLSRKRKASLVGSLLRKFMEHPETYGKFISSDMFGYMPGPLTQQDYNDPAAPVYKAPSTLMAAVGGAAQGAGSYFNNQAAAENEVLGRIRGATGPTSAGQPVGSSALAGSTGIRNTGGMYDYDERA